MEHDTCIVYISPNFIKQAGLLWFNYYDAFENHHRLFQFFQRQDGEGASIVFFGNLPGWRRSPHQRSGLDEAIAFTRHISAMIILTPANNKYHIPNTNAARLVETLTETTMDPAQCFVVGSNGGQCKKPDTDRAFASNLGIQYIPLNALLPQYQPAPWSWRFSFPSIHERRTLINANNQQPRPSIAKALMDARLTLVIVTGPPSCGKHFFAKQLLLLWKQLSKGDPVVTNLPFDDCQTEKRVCVDNTLDWFTVPPDALIIDIKMNLTLCKCLDHYKVHMAQEATVRLKTDRDFANWRTRHEQLERPGAFPSRIEYTNKLELEDKKEFWYHY